MTKDTFIRLFAKEADITLKDARKFLTAFEKVMRNNVFNALDSVRLEFGTFSGVIKKYSARTMTNPQNGEVYNIPPKTVVGYPKFKPTLSRVAEDEYFTYLKNMELGAASQKKNKKTRKNSLAFD